MNLTWSHARDAWLRSCATIALASAASAQCLDWASGFECPGADQWVRALAVYDDGSGAGTSLYAGGDFSIAGTAVGRGIARWDGSSWSPLGTGGGLGGTPNGTPIGVQDMVVFDDGGGSALYAGGVFSSIDGLPAGGFARWDGTSWTPLGPNVSNSVVFDLTEFDDGLGGGPAVYGCGFVGGANVARWSGTSWVALGVGSNIRVQALAGFDDGGGPALYAGSLLAPYIQRWNGSTWTNVGAGLFDEVKDLVVFDDGMGGGAQLYAGGNVGVRRWDGSTWTSLAPPFLPNSLDVVDLGLGPALYASGQASGIGNPIFRWTGSSWVQVTTGSGFDSNQFQELAAFDGGSGPELIASGGFTGVNGVHAEHIARLTGGSWAPLGSGTNYAGDIHALASWNDGNGSRLYAPGTVSGLRSWNGSSWSDIGPTANGAILVLAPLDDGSGESLYAGGTFSAIGTLGASHVARWNGSTWSSLGGGVTHGGNEVFALASFDDGLGGGRAIYVGGSFLTAGGISTSRIARWNGSTWSTLGGGVNKLVYALATFDDGTGDALYAAGIFTTAGGVSSNRIAKWDGVAWSALGSGLDDDVRALAVFDDGTGSALYAAGDFQNADGAPANRVARWNGTSWSPLGTGLNAPAYALTVYNAGPGATPVLVATGEFTTAGGQTVNRIARWDGASWQPFGGGTPIGLDDRGLALAVWHQDPLDVPSLFVGGEFAVAGGRASCRIAELTPSCPCPPLTYCTAKTNSAGCTPAITISGAPSASAGSGCIVGAEQVLANKAGLFFYSIQGANALPFQGGHLCAKMPVKRTPIQTSSASGAPPCTGTFGYEFNARIASGADPTLVAGRQVWSQWWTRDAGVTSGTGLTNGLTFTICP